MSFNYHLHRSRKIIEEYLSMIKEEADKWLNEKLKKEPTKIQHMVKDMINDKS